MQVYIYSLTDPNTNLIRYIGMSRRPYRRFRDYMCARGGHTVHMRNWLNSLKRAGQAPLFEIIDECSEEDCDKTEIKWIAAFRGADYPLINSTAGGEGRFTHSLEVRKHLSEVAKMQGRRPPPRSAEALARIAEASRLRGGDPNHFIALNKSRIGIPLTEEHKRKLSAALKGRVVTEETRRRMSVGRILMLAARKRSIRSSTIDSNHG